LRLIDVAAALVPTALAAGFVIYSLGARSLWIDEGDTFTTASQHGSALWHWMLNDGGNMFTYYAGMHVVIALFGTSPIALRLPSALALVGTVPLAFALTRRLFDLRAATISAFLVAASLPLVYWGQNARAYTVAVLLVTASTYAFVCAVQTRKRWAYVLYVVCSVLAIYTILLSALVVVAQCCSLVLRRRHETSLSALAACAGSIALLSVPIGIAAAIRGTVPIEWIPPPTLSLDKYVLNFVASARVSGVSSTPTTHLLLEATLVTWAGAAFLFIYSLVRTGRSEDTWAIGLIGSCFVVPIAGILAITELVHPVFSDRYVLSSLPAASMLAGVAISRFRPAALALVAGAALVILRSLQIPASYGSPIETWNTATADVVSSAQPQDCIAFFVADGFTAFDYYVLATRSPHPPLPRPVLPLTTWVARTPYALDPAVIPANSLAGVVAGCPRLWVVWTHQGGEPPGTAGALPYQVRKYEAFNVLAREVNGAYRLVSYKQFTSVDVALYDRRPLEQRSARSTVGVFAAP
jgi:mannosyltransferase